MMSLTRKMLLFLIIHFLLLQSLACNACKCMPRDSCWPDSASWQSFNASIAGNLLAPKPYGSPCHNPHYDAAACSSARASQTNAFERSNVVGAMQYPNWEAGFNSTGCPIGTNRSTPCFQGQVPVYAVNVSQISHIRSAIAFAKLYNLRLVIKSTGHDWLGRSTAAGSLCIWLHHLKRISDHEAFLPQGCTDDEDPDRDHLPAVTAESGVTWDELYDFLDARGHRVVVGGMGSSVSAAGGYVQGGGHSPLSRKLGLGADNVLEFLVITADEQVRIANRCQNKDLFWALSGGGAGTYGVVVSATLRTFPALSGIVQSLYLAASIDVESQKSLIRKFVEVTPSMDDAGLAGYFYVYRNALLLSFLLPNGTASAAADAFLPLVSYVELHPGLFTVNYTVTEYSTFVEWHDGVLCPQNPGVCTDLTGAPRRLATRFMPREIIQDSPELLTEAFMEILYNRSFSPIFGLFVVGGEVSNVEGKNNSISDFWRNSLWHVSLSRGWNESTSLEEQREIAEYLTETIEVLRKITPGGGCYKNEADYFEPDWQQSFYGEKYSSLKAIKRKVDPTDLFVCWKCVGSEIWMEQCEASSLSPKICH